MFEEKKVHSEGALLIYSQLFVHTKTFIRSIWLAVSSVHKYEKKKVANTHTPAHTYMQTNRNAHTNKRPFILYILNGILFYIYIYVGRYSAYPPVYFVELSTYLPAFIKCPSFCLLNFLNQAKNWFGSATIKIHIYIK